MEVTWRGQQGLEEEDLSLQRGEKSAGGDGKGGQYLQSVRLSYSGSARPCAKFREAQMSTLQPRPDRNSWIEG